MDWALYNEISQRKSKSNVKDKKIDVFQIDEFVCDAGSRVIGDERVWQD